MNDSHPSDGGLAARIATRLGGLFPMAEDDPRLGWLPERPDVLEAHLRSADECDLVLGYSGERADEFEGFMGRLLSLAHERGCTDRRDLFATWMAAGGDMLDIGAQIAPALDRLQLYHRDHYTLERAVSAFASVGIAVHERVLANTLALLALSTVEMLGLELGEESTSPAVYVSVPNRGQADMARITDSVGFLLSALLHGTEAYQLWHGIASQLLYAPTLEEWVYISFDPREEPRWLKVDVSQRPLALVEHLLDGLGTHAPGLCATAERHGFDPLAHLGIRFSAEGAKLSVYASLT